MSFPNSGAAGKCLIIYNRFIIFLALYKKVFKNLNLKGTVILDTLYES